jgi:enterochelin esterase-like enzyme
MNLTRGIHSILGLALAACTAIPAAAQSQPAATGHFFFRVQVAASVSGPVSGRLLVFLKQGKDDKEVSLSEFHPEEVWVAAREVRNLAPGSAVELDADELAYPKGFSALTPGDYEAQAVLDVDHNYNYRGQVPEDWQSNVVSLAAWTPASGTEPVLMLDHHPETNPRRTAMIAAAQAQMKPGEEKLEEFESPMLSAFWGRAIKIRAWVILPPGYDRAKTAYDGQKAETYPTAYWTHGFGGDIDGSMVSGMRLRQRMVDGKMPPMIWVMLDESIEEGTHEFADSVNNGPWGAALTREFIPYLEAKYRMDARPTGRLLNGHSSGGWATLQLQVNYPDVFGGTWSTSPDPSDFHDFSGVDLYAANANFFHRADGSAVPIFRDKGAVVATAEQLTRIEDVTGSFGGQISSFDWVFSPKGKSGAPMQMFDHATGAVNPDVIAYWHDHYDLAHDVEVHWAERGASLKGRIHLIVGTADTFYLDGPAHRFEAVLNRLGAEPHFSYLQDRTHFDLYGVDKDPQGLFNQIGAEMWAVARPGVDWKTPPAVGQPVADRSH